MERSEAVTLLPQLEFNNDDTAMIETTVSNTAQFNFDLNAAHDFLVLALNGTAPNVTVMVGDQVAIYGAQSGGLAFAVIKPDVAMPVCHGNRTVCTMTVVMKSDDLVPIKLRAFRGRMLYPGQIVPDTVIKKKTKVCLADTIDRLRSYCDRF